MTYMKRHLFDHIDLPQDQYFLPNGKAAHLEKECLRYDQLIEDVGGIDLQLLESVKMGISVLTNQVPLSTQKLMSCS